MPFRKFRFRKRMRGRRFGKGKSRYMKKAKSYYGSAVFNPSRYSLSTQLVAPPSMLVRLPYNSGGTLSGLPYVDYTFSLNNCFDPDVTGTGHQPRGFDQWATLYNQYRVISAQVVVDFSNVGNVVTTVAGIRPSSGTSALTTSITDCIESPYSKWRFIGDAGYSPTQCRLKQSFNIMKWFGLSKNDYSSDDLTSLTTTSPAKQLYLILFAGDNLNGTNIIVQFNIRIIYDVLFSELSNPGAS